MQGSWGERGGVRVSPLADGCGIGAAYRRVSRPPPAFSESWGEILSLSLVPGFPTCPLAAVRTGKLPFR